MAKYITIICRVKGQTVVKLIDDFDCVEDNVFHYYDNDCDQTQTQTHNDFDLNRVKQEVVDNEVEPQNKLNDQFSHSPQTEDYFDSDKTFAYLWNDPNSGSVDDNQSMEGYKKYLSVIKSTGRQMFFCKTKNCNYQTMWKNAIVNHIRSNHQHFFPFVCDFPDCGKKFAIRSNLNNHRKVHSKRSALLEGVSIEESSQSSADFNHNFSQNLVKKRNVFDLSNNKRHYRKKISETIIKKRHIISNKKKKSMKDQSNHSIDDKITPKKVWPTSSQTPVYVGIKSVEQFIETTERNGSIWRMCRLPDCSYGTRYATSMVYHIRNTHLNDKPFICAFCGKRFAMRTNLNNHKKVHKSAKPDSPEEPDL